MKSNPRITYFLGAGASYNSVPVINELQKQLGELTKQISFQNHLSSKYNKEIEKFDKYLKSEIQNLSSNNLFSYLLYELSQLSERSLKYSTIDTFALYCKHQNPQYYIVIKHILNIYFTLWQARKNIENKVDNPMVWEEIDPRYIGLISAIFRKEEKLMISENINFITWNYDTQLERAINLFTNEDESLLQICKASKVYPICEVEESKIIHLNGISGFFKNNNEDIKMLNQGFEKTLLEHFYELTLNYQNATKINEDSSLIQFSWDEEITYNKAINQSREIISKSDYIIIIGYSFPLFNRKADVAMMNALRSDCKIVIQNPNFSEETFVEYFGDTFKNRSIDVKDSSQFYVPSEYFTELNSNKGNYYVV